MDKRLPTLVTFIDFKNAFDCAVRHLDQIGKIKRLRLDLNFVKLIHDYLSHRKQRVIANNCKSDVLDIRQAVPQGSILGPLLYADDIHRVIKKYGFSFYADDTVLYSARTNFDVAKRIMQENLNYSNTWCNENGIYTNVNKTKYMVFGSKYTLMV